MGAKTKLFRGDQLGGEFVLPLNKQSWDEKFGTKQKIFKDVDLKKNEGKVYQWMERKLFQVFFHCPLKL